MPDYITLSCPSCGHKLQITSDIDRFACAACGNEHMVNRSGGIVTLKPVIDSIKKVQVGVDKTASELAIVRIDKEISQLRQEIREISGIENKYAYVYKELKLPVGFVIVLSIVFAFVGSGLFQILCIVASIYFAAVLVIGRQRYKEEIEIILEETKLLKDKIETKLKERAEHQKIVSRYK